MLSSQGKVLQAWRDSMRSNGGSPVFASWGVGDPCIMRWDGVLCDNGTVVGIQLQPPNSNVMANTFAQGPIDWQVLTNLTSLRTLGVQVSEVLTWEKMVVVCNLTPSTPQTRQHFTHHVHLCHCAVVCRDSWTILA